MGFKSRKPRVGIHVTMDPDGEALERCFKCYRRTAYWYTPKDVACCQTCAEVVRARDVPTKIEWFDATNKFNRFMDGGAFLTNTQ